MVEESLRLEAPVTFLMRRAREDAEIGGSPVHRGEHVMFGIASARRVRPRARLRGPPRPREFGGAPRLRLGLHVCVWNHQTRMVGRVVLEETHDRFAPRALRLAPGLSWRCVAHLQECGPETLRVVVAASAWGKRRGP